MRRIASLLVLLMLSSTITGCLWWEDEEEVRVEEGPFVFDQAIPITTWYHYPGTVSAPWAVDAADAAALTAANITANLSGNSTPYFTNATYYGTGFDTFEPTKASETSKIDRAQAKHMYLSDMTGGNLEFNRYEKRLFYSPWFHVGTPYQCGAQNGLNHFSELKKSDVEDESSCNQRGSAGVEDTSSKDSLWSADRNLERKAQRMQAGTKAANDFARPQGRKKKG